MPALPRSLRTPLMLALVAMLLLRVWVGDAMAMAMPDAAAPAAAHAAMPDRAGAPAMPCHEAAPPADVAQHAGHGTVPATDAGPTGEHCGTCMLCQVCHSVAMTEAFTTAQVFSLPQAAPQQTSQRFASAEPQPGLKPPIS